MGVSPIGSLPFKYPAIFHWTMIIGGRVCVCKHLLFSSYWVWIIYITQAIILLDLWIIDNKYHKTLDWSSNSKCKYRLSWFPPLGYANGSHDIFMVCVTSAMANPSKKPLRLSIQLQPLTCVWLLQIGLLQCWICQDIWTCVEEINKCHRYTHALAWWISWGPIFSGSWRKNAMAMYLCIISSIIYYLLFMNCSIWDR